MGGRGIKDQLPLRCSGVTKDEWAWIRQLIFTNQSYQWLWMWRRVRQEPLTSENSQTVQGVKTEGKWGERETRKRAGGQNSGRRDTGPNREPSQDGAFWSPKFTVKGLGCCSLLGLHSWVLCPVYIWRLTPWGLFSLKKHCKHLGQIAEPARPRVTLMSQTLCMPPTSSWKRD